MTRPLQAALVAVLLLGAGVIGFGAYRLLAPDPKQSSAATVNDANDRSGTGSAVGGATASEGATASDAATANDAATSTAAAGKPIPEKRPVFSLTDRDGRMRSITEWDGKSMVINFWATWCAPCRREIPMLNALHAARAKENVEVIGIAVDFRERVLEYVREVEIGYPLLIGEQDGLDALAQFGIDSAGFPLTVFTDNQGRILTAHLGELHPPEADLILDALLAVNTGKRSLDQAREEIAAGLERIEAASKSPPG
jgi:thiol-disulfide isomerase/thioredoxin